MPNRIIKESICTSDSIDGLTWFEECFFYRLIVNCDDYGRMDARTPILRARLFPLKSVTDKQIESALQSLRTAAMIDLYDVDGRSFLQLRTWENHQSIRAKKSKFPSPVEHLQANDFNCKQMKADESKCPRNPIQSESNPNPNPNPSIPAQRKHGEFGWVKLTDEEHKRLLTDLGQEETGRCIRYVDESAQSTGNKNKWKDWNLTVRKCSRDGWGKKKEWKPAQTGYAEKKSPPPSVEEVESMKKFLQKLKEEQ